MSAIQAATLYVGLNILVLVVLIVLVVRQRRQLKCAIGDGGHPTLVRAIRAHANAVEVMPMALIGLVALASAGASTFVVHLLGCVLTLGRCLHAYGLSNSEGTSFGRMAGMLLSLVALIGIAIACVVTAL
jgi:uncharacterized membrane protein YecN with MAPEG domain